MYKSHVLHASITASGKDGLDITMGGLGIKQGK